MAISQTIRTEDRHSSANLARATVRLIVNCYLLFFYHPPPPPPPPPPPDDPPPLDPEEEDAGVDADETAPENELLKEDVNSTAENAAIPPPVYHDGE